MNPVYNCVILTSHMVCLTLKSNRKTVDALFAERKNRNTQFQRSTWMNEETKPQNVLPTAVGGMGARNDPSGREPVTVHHPRPEEGHRRPRVGQSG